MIFLNQVHPDTFTLDLSLYIKLAWADNRIELANGSVNVDQSFMGLVRLEIHRFLIEFYNKAVNGPINVDIIMINVKPYQVWKPDMYIWDLNGQ